MSVSGSVFPLSLSKGGGFPVSVQEEVVSLSLCLSFTGGGFPLSVSVPPSLSLEQI